MSAFPCPKCGGECRTIDSRPVKGEERPKWRRRRECYGCEHRFTTYEIPVGEEPVPEPTAAAVFQQDVANALERYQRLTNGGGD
jgi:transcriptional regulator NrdR family protein